jgi:3'(2'), 5'-bisphosphate nucleotidase
MTSGALTDEALAEQLAGAAGDILLELRATTPLEGRELGVAGDGASQEFLARALTLQRPQDAVLSEEAVDDVARLEADRVWIIDPLDGTREYGEGRQDWAVHVSLVIGGAPSASAVALAPLGRVLTSAEPCPLAKATGRPPRIAVSRSRSPAIAGAVAERLGAELVPLGSAGFKAMSVVMGKADAYLHAGGQYEWDSAAPVGVAVAAGLHASRIDGTPLVYNRPDPVLPDLLICRRELAEELLSAVASEAALES